jgi:predicted DNA-binding protein
MILTNFFISRPLIEQLRVLAKAEDRSMASIVREAITNLLQSRAYVERRPTKPVRRSAKKA